MKLIFLDENKSNFFHNFLYHLYIIYNIKFCLLIQISLDSQTFLIPSARFLRRKGCFSIILSSLWLNTNIDMGENTDTSFPLYKSQSRSTSIAAVRRMGLRGSGVQSVVRRGFCPYQVCGSLTAELSGRAGAVLVNKRRKLVQNNQRSCLPGPTAASGQSQISIWLLSFLPVSRVSPFFPSKAQHLPKSSVLGFYSIVSKSYYSLHTVH